MKITQTCKIWTISDDKKEYERYKYLLEKPEEKGLCVQDINTILQEKAVSSFVGEPYVTIIHDESNIRKEYSEKMECLSKVQSLNSKLVNGYHSLNSIALASDKLHLLACKPYSTEELGYNHPNKELFFNAKSLLFEQLAAISLAFKKADAAKVLIHIIDRGEDDQKVFDYIDQDLKDKFIIRLKLNRNSSIHLWSDEKNKEIPLKISKKEFKSNFTQIYDHFSWRGKSFKKVKAEISYEYFFLGKNQYAVVRVQLYDRQNQKIFKNPMLLSTNFDVQHKEMALRIFHLYLKRSKIEGVFKFLKSQLGWEEFQIQDLLAIKHILVLCYFIGAYFCELEPQIINNEFMQIICKLGGGKGKVSLHFFLSGIKKMYHYEQTRALFEEKELSQEDIDKLLKFTK